MYYTCRHILPIQLARGLETIVLRERAERVHRRALLVTLSIVKMKKFIWNGNNFTELLDFFVIFCLK